jgi:1-acyl-sn-glycerol-3-phosphate acyltransferase
VTAKLRLSADAGLSNGPTVEAGRSAAVVSGLLRIGRSGAAGRAEHAPPGCTGVGGSSWPGVARSGPPCPGLRRPAQRLLGQALRWLCTPLVVEGVEHAAGLVGPTLLVANHASHLDAPLVLASLPDEVRARLAVAAAEDRFFGGQLLGLAVSVGLGAFPFPRGRGCALGLVRARHLLEAGWHVLLFPEGTRSRDGRRNRFRPGAAHLARAAGVPILPIGIDGAHALLPPGARLPRRGPVRLRFGAPYRPPPDQDVETTTAALEARVAELVAPSGRAGGACPFDRRGPVPPTRPDTRPTRTVLERGALT